MRAAEERVLRHLRISAAAARQAAGSPVRTESGARGRNGLVRVGDLMHREVVAVEADASFPALFRAFQQQHLGAIPVLDEERRVVGTVSQADLLAHLVAPRLPFGPARLHRPPERVRDVMTRPAVTVGPQTVAEVAVRLAARHRLSRLPVTGRDGELLGMVGREDLLSALLPETAEAGGGQQAEHAEEHAEEHQAGHRERRRRPWPAR